MQASGDNPASRGLRGWWSSPPRSGLRLVIAPWEYRHLRAWARVRIASGVLAAALGALTLALGGEDWKTYGWALVFAAIAAANVAFAGWDLSIARSEAR